MDTVKSLRLRIQTLAPIVLGLNQALTKLELSDEERSVLAKILEKSGSEYESARRTLKEYRTRMRSENPKPTRPKRGRAKSVDKIQLSYVKEREKKIQDTHQVSGFDRQWISIVQGGAPGSGKNS